MRNNNYLLKTFMVLFLAIVVSTISNAQNGDKEMSTLFGNKDGHIYHGGWGGLTFGYTQIQGKDTYLMGARGGWLVDHHLTIGLAGQGFISDKEYLNILPNNSVHLAGGYGGLFLEAIIAPNYPVHVTIPVIIGAGGVAYFENRPWDEHYNYPHDYSIDHDVFFVFEPGLEVEVNLMRFMRFAVGGSYRYTSQVSMINSNPSMLRGFNGYFELKFGKF